MSFFSKTRIKATELFNDAFEYLQRTYDQSIEVFTPASPFGQILTVLANLGELIFFYIEAVATELNIARARNLESIYGLSRLTGHDPTRGISARGIIGLRLNTSASSQVSGPYVQINNYAKLEISQNGLSYFIRFDSDFLKLEKSNPEFINVELVQGELETQTFTGTGFDLQSFNIVTKEATDQDFIKVTVDGYRYEVVDSLYDMDPGIKAVMIKTSITGGLSVFFGNKQFGYPPPLGSIIEVEYLKTRGTQGNLNGKTLDIKFIDSGVDTFGEDVDLNEFLALNVTRMPNFGSDSEDPDFTRLIAPYMSRSFVLANPNNYIYYLRKYSYFSFINAYNTKDDMYLNDDNIIYLFLIPDIKKKLTTDKDYFDVDIEEFTLTQVEKDQVIEILNQSGRQVVTAEVRIDDPIVKRYVLNIVLRFFDNVDKDVIRNNVRSVLNDYFLNVNRRDRIPRSDLISIIEGVEGVDSVNIFFLSEANETAIRQGYYEVPVYGIDPATDQKTLIEMKQIILNPGDDPQLGLDGFGDVVIGNDELALIRGGWTDRNGNLYEEIPNPTSMSSLNVFFKEEIPYNVYNASQQAAFDTLRRNRGTTIATSQNSRSTNTGRLQSTPPNRAIKKV
jgi:hypothetical protein